MTRRHAFLVAAAATLAAPAPAAAVLFGANLNNATPTLTATCADAPPGLFFPVGSGSCMWTDLGLTPPASGRVTSVQVKVGASTGPMRVNVVRYLFRQTGDTAHPFTAGPFLQSYGPRFTPAANATTTVPTDLAVQEDPTPAPTDLQTIQVIDVLALEVEAGNVAIPMLQTFANTSTGVYPGPTAAGVPAPSPNGIPGSYLTFGWTVLMTGDLTPTTAGGGGGGGGGGAGNGGGGGTVTAPAVTLPRGTATVRNGAAQVPLQCQGADCAGLITLLRAAGASAAAAGPVTYGSARFALKAGSRATVKVRLNARGRSLLKRRKAAKISAKVTSTSGGGAAKRFALTLRRP